MDTSADDVLRIAVFGIRKKSTLKGLRECATGSGCMFLEVPVRKGDDQVTSIFPSMLGTFLVLREDLTNLIRPLRPLVQTLKDAPLSIQAEGDIVDFRKSQKAIEKALLKSRRQASNLPIFEDSLRTLDRVGVRYIRKVDKLAAETAERYPRRGPHSKMVCT